MILTFNHCFPMSILDRLLTSRHVAKTILYTIVTNMSHLYRLPTTLSPIGMSDHRCVLWQPEFPATKPNTLRKKTVRPISSRAQLENWATWITQHNWDEMELAKSNPTLMCEALCNSIMTHVDLLIPTKMIKYHITDKAWMTAQIKTNIQKRQQAYQQGRLPLWRYLRNKVKQSISNAKKTFYNTRVQNLKKENPAAWYKQIKILTQGHL